MIASRILLQQLLAGLNFTVDAENLFCLYKRKKWFLCVITAAQTAGNHGDARVVTSYLQWGIYTSISTRTHSDGVAEAPSLKITFHGISLKWSQKPFQSTQE